MSKISQPPLCKQNCKITKLLCKLMKTLVVILSFLALIYIIFLGIKLGTALLFLITQLNHMVLQVTTISIEYTIEASVESLDTPILKCRMFDPKENDTECSDFAKAWVNNFVYQEAVMSKSEVTWENVRLSGIIKIGPTQFYSIETVEKIGFGEAEKTYIYNMERNDNRKLMCFEFNNEEFCEDKRPGSLMEEIVGVKSLNVTGFVGSDEKKRMIFSELKYTNAEFKSSLKEVEEKVFQHDNLRKSLCKCQDENKFLARLIPATDKEIPYNCLDEYYDDPYFNPYMSHWFPPTCFGGNTFK